MQIGAIRQLYHLHGQAPAGASRHANTLSHLQAVCTPEFFLFDPDFKLQYHGQFDSARPSNGVPVTGQHPLPPIIHPPLALFAVIIAASISRGGSHSF